MQNNIGCILHFVIISLQVSLCNFVTYLGTLVGIKISYVLLALAFSLRNRPIYMWPRCRPRRLGLGLVVVASTPASTLASVSAFWRRLTSLRLTEYSNVIIPDESFYISASIMDCIARLKYRLSDIIEPDFGLLDELLSLDVLTDRQYAQVRSGYTTVYERNDALLDLLTSEEQCDKFLTALRRTQQEHVVNFIRENGGQ